MATSVSSGALTASPWAPRRSRRSPARRGSARRQARSRDRLVARRGDLRGVVEEEAFADVGAEREDVTADRSVVRRAGPDGDPDPGVERRGAHGHFIFDGAQVGAVVRHPTQAARARLAALPVHQRRLQAGGGGEGRLRRRMGGAERGPRAVVHLPGRRGGERDLEAEPLRVVRPPRLRVERQGGVLRGGGAGRGPLDARGGGRAGRRKGDAQASGGRGSAGRQQRSRRAWLAVQGDASNVAWCAPGATSALRTAPVATRALGGGAVHGLRRPARSTSHANSGNAHDAQNRPGATSRREPASR